MSEENNQPIIDNQKNDQIIQLKSELEEYKKKAEEYLNGWKRAKADYINYKKEQEKNQTQLIKLANLALILKLLPVANNFKRAFRHLKEESPEKEWLEGIKNIKKQFDDLLENLGLEPIKTEGEKFDPEKHEAVSQEKIEGKESGLVIREIEAGYTLAGKVIWPAKVVVNE